MGHLVCKEFTLAILLIVNLQFGPIFFSFKFCAIRHSFLLKQKNGQLYIFKDMFQHA